MERRGSRRGSFSNLAAVGENVVNSPKNTLDPNATMTSDSEQSMATSMSVTWRKRELEVEESLDSDFLTDVHEYFWSFTFVCPKNKLEFFLFVLNNATSVFKFFVEPAD